MKTMIIAHQINTLDGLSKVPSACGVEIDVHSYETELVAHHDPMVRGTDLGTLMDACGRRFIIFNIKEEGIETKVVEMAVDRGIEEFFLLDLSFPALIKMVRTGENRVAVRLSQYEPSSTALSLSGLASWVWVDVFEGLHLDATDYRTLKNAKYKVCLVSPELYPSRGYSEVLKIQDELHQKDMTIDAVCTKRPDWWEDWR